MNPDTRLAELAVGRSIRLVREGGRWQASTLLHGFARVYQEADTPGEALEALVKLATSCSLPGKEEHMSELASS